MTTDAPGAASAGTQRPRARLAILISGRGSNMLAIARACAAGGLHARVVGVVADRAEAAGLGAARELGLDTRVIERGRYPTREAFDAALGETLEALAPDLVALAGFMRVLGAPLVERWRGRMVNIHPSLLPSYRGLDTHARALADGAREHGASVHFVVPELDAGELVAQARVPVLPGDTPERLAARVLAEEHELYVTALARVLAALPASPRPGASPERASPHGALDGSANGATEAAARSVNDTAGGRSHGCDDGAVANDAIASS